MKSIFKHSVLDGLLIAVIPFQLAVFIYAAMQYSNYSWWVFLIYFPIHILLSLQGTSANHNHYHCPVFSSKFLNSLARMGFSAIGDPKTPLNLGHGIHHANKESFNQQSALAVMSLDLPVHRQIIRFFKYSFLAFGPHYVMYFYLLRNRSPEQLAAFAMPEDLETGKRYFTLLTKPRNRLAAELDVLVWFIFRVTLCVVDWQFFVFYFIPANFLIDTFRQNENFVQHWGATDPNDSKRDAVSCYGFLYNLLTFNLGYHQEHHHKPAEHWLRLPAVRETLPSDRRVVPFVHYLNMPIFYPSLSKKLKNSAA